MYIKKMIKYFINFTYKKLTFNVIKEKRDDLLHISEQRESYVTQNIKLSFSRQCVNLRLSFFTTVKLLNSLQQKSALRLLPSFTPFVC